MKKDFANIRNTINRFKAMSTKEKIDLFVTCLIIYAACFALCGFAVGLILSLINGKHGFFYMGFIDSSGRFFTFLLSMFLFLPVLGKVIRKDLSNKIYSADERGVSFMEKGTHGSARWMEEDEIKNSFNMSSANDTVTTIYGQLGTGGRRVVSYKYLYDDEQDRKKENNNAILLGSPGTGKSYAYVRTELLQTIKRGHSFVVTDPSGELYTDLNQFCENNGYKVLLLNLDEPKYSDNWNCMQECLSPLTHRLDAGRLNEFAEVYIKNSNAEGKQEAFWSDSAKNLLKAVIGFCSFQKEIRVEDYLITLYHNVSFKGDDVDDNELRNMPFNLICSKIEKRAQDNGFDINKIREIENNIISLMESFDMSMVFDTVMNFNDLDTPKYGLSSEIGELFKKAPNNHPGKIAYQIYKSNGSETVKGSALQGLQLRLQAFNNDDIMNTLVGKGIDIPNINKEATACFVIMSDKSTATKPIASLFFSFFFKDAQESFDNAEHRAQELNMPNVCLPVTVMLDEFYSIGVIGGDPANFTIVMSNSRKRALRINIIVQSYRQIASLYGDDNANTILSDTNTILYLGCNDEQTAKFISMFATGEATVLNETHVEGSNLFNIDNALADLRLATTKRALLTVDEARRWKGKMLVVQRGEFPLKLDIFPWKEHPFYKKGLIQPKSFYKTKGSIITDSIKIPIDKRKLEKEKNILNETDSLLREASKEVGKKRVNSLTSKEKKKSEKPIIDVKNSIKECIEESSETFEKVTPKNIFTIRD